MLNAVHKVPTEPGNHEPNIASTKFLYDKQSMKSEDLTGVSMAKRETI